MNKTRRNKARKRRVYRKLWVEFQRFLDKRSPYDLQDLHIISRAHVVVRITGYEQDTTKQG